MIALARCSWTRATASSPRADSSCCSSERSAATTAGAVTGAGCAPAVARRAQPPRPLTRSAPTTSNPPRNISFCVLVRIILSCKTVRSPPICRLPVNPGSRLAGGGTPPRAALAPGLLHQPNRAQFHGSIGGLHHVVHGEQGHRNGCQRFHLDAGPSLGAHRRPHPHSGQRIVEPGLHRYVLQPDRVAERDQVGRALRRHRPRHLRHRQDVSLGHGLIGHEPERLGRHPDLAFRRGCPCRDGLIPHVHHPRPAVLIQVRERHHTSARSSERTAASSCGFTLPCACSRASSTRAIASVNLRLGVPAARTSSRNRSNNPSSITVNAPRAWNGICRKANSYRAGVGARAAAKNCLAASCAPWLSPF